MAALGHRWTWRLWTATCRRASRRVPSPRTVWPSSSVLQRVAAIKRGDPAPRYVGGVERRLTPELLDEIREFIEEERERISVKIVKSLHVVSFKQSSCHPNAAFASVGGLCRAPSGGPSHP